MSTNKRNTILLTGITLVSAFTVTACTTASWYQGAQYSGQAECSKQPPGAAYEECMRQYDKTWNEYQKQREEATQK